MAERPNYVPPLWTQDWEHSWVSKTPMRVLALLVIPTIIVVVVALRFFLVADAVDGAICSAIGVGGVIQAAVYAPRALRAAKVAPPDGEQHGGHT
jgi:hypothetical protein